MIIDVNFKKGKEGRIKPGTPEEEKRSLERSKKTYLTTRIRRFFDTVVEQDKLTLDEKRIFGNFLARVFDYAITQTGPLFLLPIIYPSKKGWCSFYQKMRLGIMDHYEYYGNRDFLVRINEFSQPLPPKEGVIAVFIMMNVLGEKELNVLKEYSLNTGLPIIFNLPPTAEVKIIKKGELITT